MGLGKTVQTLARIVEGASTAAERKAGYKGGTLSVFLTYEVERMLTF